jgi:leucyl/phenylalanyl-tRNA--protein transferase
MIKNVTAVEMSRAPFQNGAANPANEHRRRELFREDPVQRLARWGLGLCYACHPKRIAEVPLLLTNMVADIRRGGTRVPNQLTAPLEPNGFAGVAKNVTADDVLEAARGGFFLWSHVGPLKWWTRQRRMVLHAGHFHIPKNIRRLLRSNKWRVTFDTAFDDVMKACAGQRAGRINGLTWIRPEIMRLYAELHDRGDAHSFEVWDAEGNLIGGGYGLSVGRVFVQESMFSLVRDTSKYGFAVFHHHLAQSGYVLTDGKDWASALKDRGFDIIPAAEYASILASHAQCESPKAAWVAEANHALVAELRAKALPPSRDQAAA